MGQDLLVTLLHQVALVAAGDITKIILTERQELMDRVTLGVKELTILQLARVAAVVEQDMWAEMPYKARELMREMVVTAEIILSFQVSGKRPAVCFVAGVAGAYITEVLIMVMGALVVVVMVAREHQEQTDLQILAAAVEAAEYLTPAGMADPVLS